MTAWIGKSIFLRLKTDLVYSGKIISADDNFLTIIDKFGNHVMIAVSEISKMEEK